MGAAFLAGRIGTRKRPHLTRTTEGIVQDRNVPLADHDLVMNRHTMGQIAEAILQQLATLPKAQANLAIPPVKDPYGRGFSRLEFANASAHPGQIDRYARDRLSGAIGQARRHHCPIAATRQADHDNRKADYPSH